MKYSILLLLVFSWTSYSQVQKYTSGSVTLRDGSTLMGELKINSLATMILFKDGETGDKMKLTARDLKFAKVNGRGVLSKISFKIINGKGKSPKIVEHITEGAISFYKILDSQNDYYRPNTIEQRSFINYDSPFNYSGGYLVGSQEVNISLMNKFSKNWFYGKGLSDIVDLFPSGRTKILQRFNDCPQAMVKFRNIDDKELDLVYFLNFYNVECAGN